MCKPQRIKDKVIGGYARICPLCGAKVHTELTGMRLYKYKDSDDILSLFVVQLVMKIFVIDIFTSR